MTCALKSSKCNCVINYNCKKKEMLKKKRKNPTSATFHLVYPHNNPVNFIIYWGRGPSWLLNYWQISNNIFQTYKFAYCLKTRYKFQLERGRQAVFWYLYSASLGCYPVRSLRFLRKPPSNKAKNASSRNSGCEVRTWSFRVSLGNVVRHETMSRLAIWPDFCVHPGSPIYACRRKENRDVLLQIFVWWIWNYV